MGPVSTRDTRHTGTKSCDAREKMVRSNILNYGGDVHMRVASNREMKNCFKEGFPVADVTIVTTWGYSTFLLGTEYSKA